MAFSLPSPSSLLKLPIFDYINYRLQKKIILNFAHAHEASKVNNHRNKKAIYRPPIVEKKVYRANRTHSKTKPSDSSAQGKRLHTMVAS